ncbi:MAG: hypothetical protein PHP08_00500 [Candidatus Dojkabacteria bacterium]|nr:hypothetical protein [Candidatus Dojkabacteria bacterium]
MYGLYHSSHDKCDLCGNRSDYNVDIWDVYSDKLKKRVYNNKSNPKIFSDEDCLRICGRCAYEIMKVSLFNLKSERDDTDFINDLKILLKVLKMNSTKKKDIYLDRYEVNNKIEEYFNSLIYKNNSVVYRIMENIFKDTKNRSYNVRAFIEEYITNKKMKITDNLYEMEMLFIIGVMWSEISQNLGLVSITEINPHKFPDIVALRKRNNITSKVNIEIERTSYDFLIHEHPIDKCDMIICWNHNWIECPEYIEVVEMSKIMENQTLITDF